MAELAKKASQQPQQKGPTVKNHDYNWEAKDARGQIRKGLQTGPSEAYVRAILRRQGMTILKIKKKSKPLLGGDSKVSERDIVIFTGQMSTMINAGLPIVQSIDLIGRSSKPGLMKLLNVVKTDVETGERLSIALSKHPKYFDKLYISLVAAGEQGGILDDIFMKLATYREKSLALKAKIKGAMFYPAAIIIMAFLITAVLMIFVIPQFADVFSGFGAELPAITLFVINLSNWFVTYWYLVFGVPTALYFAFNAAYQRIPVFTQQVDRFSLKIPVVGEILLKGAIARFSRTFATMHGAGVPMTESLETVAHTAGNLTIEGVLVKTREEVAAGRRLAQPLEESGVFPPMVPGMIGIGEESGSLETMLTKIADFYDREVDEAVKTLTSLMEPAIMAILGVLIGGLVIAMYLPIFKLGAVVGG